MAETSGEKTEEATPKRLEDAKKEGNVPKSVDAAGFVALAAAILACAALLGLIASGLLNFFRYSFSKFGSDLGADSLASIALTSAFETLKMTIPLAAIVAIFGAIGYILQFGLIFTAKPLKPDIKKLDPIKGFGNLFSMQKFLDGFKITAKVLIAVGVSGKFLWDYVAELPRVQTAPLGYQLGWLLEKSLIVALVMLLVFFFFAIADLAIVRYFHFKRLRMSKQEIRDEFKQLEGSPEVKSRIRRIQIEMSRKRMMNDVKTASVVVTNPTHFAVALRYKEGKDAAPIVVAKGADKIAIKIKEIAYENDIPVVENAPLARQLYKEVDIGRIIPEALYQAVIDVLAFVYRTRGRVNADR